MSMNILAYNIVRQPNGKFAAWNTEEEGFEYTNFETAEKLKNHILDRADTALTDNIRYADSHGRFEMYAETFKAKHGLIDDAKEEARATLLAMGESVEGC